MSILNKNRILSLLLALTVLVALYFSVFSIQIFAEPESDSETEVESEGESESGVITTGESESESTGESESEAESSGETESSTTPATTDDTSDNSDNGVNVGQIVSFVILGVPDSETLRGYSGRSGRRCDRFLYRPQRKGRKIR